MIRRRHRTRQHLFTAHLQSRLPFVRFVGNFHIRWWCADQSGKRNIPYVLALVRSTVRHRAGEVLRKEDPYDVGAAQDALLLKLPNVLTPKKFPDLKISFKSVQIGLEERSKPALESYDQARQWEVQHVNAVHARADAITKVLAKRGTGLSWMLNKQSELTSDKIEEIVSAWERIPEVREQDADSDPIVDPLVDLFREFIEPMADPAQRQLVLKTLPSFFKYYGQYDLAVKAERSAGIYPEGDGSVSLSDQLGE